MLSKWTIIQGQGRTGYRANEISAPSSFSPNIFAETELEVGRMEGGEKCAIIVAASCNAQSGKDSFSPPRQSLDLVQKGGRGKGVILVQTSSILFP